MHRNINAGILESVYSCIQLYSKTTRCQANPPPAAAPEEKSVRANKFSGRSKNFSGRTAPCASYLYLLFDLTVADIIHRYPIVVCKPDHQVQRDLPISPLIQAVLLSCNLQIIRQHSLLQIRIFPKISDSSIMIHNFVIPFLCFLTKLAYAAFVRLILHSKRCIIISVTPIKQREDGFYGFYRSFSSAGDL